MDSFNFTTAASMLGTDLNDTLNDNITLTKIRPTRIIVIPSLAIFLVCLLGLPGNLFVLAVYLGKMTSSTRTYMFALAVADSAVCVCGILLTRVLIDFISMQVIMSTIDVAITFSVYLLVFVAIERLLAVRRPHSFSIDAQRAKKALTVIFVIAVLIASVMTVARLIRNTLLKTVFPMTIIVMCVITMAVCYTLMATTLLKKARDASKRTGIARESNLHEPGSPKVPVSVNLNPMPSTSATCARYQLMVSVNPFMLTDDVVGLHMLYG
ncbi:hypothetical protein NP493_228g03018 [Ridgeia piscesae]|uniref:G-protein coupled receptors family 1 profile domain-containing protein n=1 Tax=Ridgeia piscesae TaxID=27915 RepID=A0AAD9P024_RIDPI|nr:hypothetical protein NP493_228g03018 [Ridgeia piscesae]